MMGVKYLKAGFYTKKNELIDKTIRGYAHLRNNKDTTEDEIQKAKINSEEVLGEIMVENGFREQGEEFISLDREFFDENGELDDKKLDEFKMLMLKYYALDDIKWSFAGTTTCYTQIMKNSIKERNLDYENMLPVELRLNFRKELKEKHQSRDPNTISIFINPDGTVSPEYIPEKSKVTFMELKDKSGFDWTKGYSPDNRVAKNGWFSGFNREGEWEKIKADKKSNEIINSKPTSPIIFYGSQYDNSENRISILLMPETKEAMLFDDDAKLMDNEEQRFYSITGELYGAREIDRDSSINHIKDSLKKIEIDNISLIVVKNDKKETIEYYKNKFKNFITTKTMFYTRTDKDLKEKLASLKKNTEEKDVSRNIISGFYSLAEKGIKGEDMYSGLIPSAVKSDFDVNLNIFGNTDDLDTFLNQPEIREVLDEDSRNYLYNAEVPDEKKEGFSNAVQNILHNYNKVFRHANMTRTELLKAAHDVAVAGETKNAKKIKIATEKNLYDFINDNRQISRKTDIPSFRSVFRKNKDLIKLGDKEEFNKWIDRIFQDENISEEVGTKIKAIIADTKVPEGMETGYSRAIQNTFDSYRNIAMSTGMRPEEVMKAINDITLNSTPNPSLEKKGENVSLKEKYKSKRVFFENDLATLVKEAAKANPNKITIQKRDINPADSSVSQPPVKQGTEKELNLLDETDLDTFVKSGFMENNGVGEAEAGEIINYLKSIKIPSGSAGAFSSGVIKSLRNFKSNTAFKGATPIKVVQAIAQMNTDFGEKRFAQIGKLNLFNKKDLDTFVNMPEFKKSELSKTELNNLIQQHSSSYQGLQNRYINKIPVKYSDKEIEMMSPAERFELKGVELPEQMQYKNLSNDIANVGWSTKFQNNEIKGINFTDFGKKYINPAAKEKINYVASYNNQQPVNNKLTYNDFKQFSPESLNVTGTNKPQVIAGGNNQVSMPYAPSGSYVQKVTGLSDISIPTMNQGFAGGQSFGNPSALQQAQGAGLQGFGNQMNFSGNMSGAGNMGGMSLDKLGMTTSGGESTGADNAMARMEANYEADRAMLARSESKNILSGTGKEFADNVQGNKIKKPVDELYDEFIEKSGNNI